jgi:hypothetical protein
METAQMPQYQQVDFIHLYELYLYIMEFYSATKKKILLFTGKQMELKNIILKEVNQVQKAKNHIFSLICEL